MQVARNSKRTSHNLWVCWGPEQVYRRCFTGSRPSQVLLPVSLLVGPDLVARFPSLRIRRSRSRLTSLAFTRRRSRSRLVASLRRLQYTRKKKASTSMDRLQVWYRHFSLFLLFLLIYFYYINFKKVTSFFSGNKQSGLRGKISCLNQTGEQNEPGLLILKTDKKQTYPDGKATRKLKGSEYLD